VTSWIVGGALVVGALGWWAYRRTREVSCTIDLESTPQEVHAHGVLDGIEVNEGDEVLVHGAPSRIPLGETRTMQARATVHQASLPRRILTRLLGTSGITELYEVGFEG